jgi:3-mercaptopyruvate sulfurtransferase SseA
MVAALAVTVLAAGMAQAQFKNEAPKAAPPATQQGAPAVQLSTLTPQPDTSLDAARRIPRDEAIKMVKEGKAVYVDVRAKDQYDLSHIKGAISIPLSELPNRWKDLPTGKFLITYCA